MIQRQSTENLVDNSNELTIPDKVDHNYLVADNVIYLVDPQITSHIDVKATKILVCNPNFNGMAAMDVGAIQTIDQDAHAVIS